MGKGAYQKFALKALGIFFPAVADMLVNVTEVYKKPNELTHIDYHMLPKDNASCLYTITVLKGLFLRKLGIYLQSLMMTHTVTI